MPIRPPSLDDRGFDDIAAEMVRRIPAHTQEWTNPRVGDPGRTLIDLFAWLADTILYRANLIPERQRLAFLRLLGLPMRPAQPARGLLALSFADDTTTQSIDCLQYSRIAKPLPFETLQDVTVLPVSAQCYIKRRPSAAENHRFNALLPDLGALYGIGGANTAAYVTTPVFADGKAEPAGRDIVADSVDGCLWLALSASPKPGVREATAAALGAGKVINIGLSPSIAVPERFEDIGLRRAIAHHWEISTGAKDDDAPDYLPLSVLSDGTGGLVRPGVIRLRLPGAGFGAPSNDVTAALRAGVGDRPPRLDDPARQAGLITWIRLRPESDTSLRHLSLAWAGINAVSIEQRETFGRRTLGHGNGASGQEFSLGAASVEAETLAVAVEDDSGLRQWRRVPDVAAAGLAEPVYSLDSEAGIIRFGDGVRGRAPQAGRLVQAASLRAGGGGAGNLPAGAITELGAAPSLKAMQPLALTGGADAEALAEAEQRIPALLRHQNRAVTLADYRELALRAPGGAVGRAEILPRFKPKQRRENAPGVVSVMVLPRRDGNAAPAPRADRPLLETVQAWLDERRALGTELYVIGCEYVPLAVSIAVELTDPDRRETTLGAVTEAVRNWLWPLSPGGPAGTGWPLGRAVQDGEIEVQASRVPGVASVAPVKLFTLRQGETQWRALPPDGRDRIALPLARWQLPELLTVLVTEGAVAATSLGATGAPGQGLSIAIPVVPELC